MRLVFFSNVGMRAGIAGLRFRVVARAYYPHFSSGSLIQASPSKELFSDDSIAREVASHKTKLFVRDAPFIDNYSRFIEGLRGQVNTLTSIEERIDIMLVMESERARAEAGYAAENVDFDKASLQWWFKHLPAKFWLSGLGLIATAFVGGIYVGHTTPVKELIGKNLPPKEQQQSLPPEVKTKVDQLTESHNRNIEKLRVAIIEEEQKAAAYPIGSIDHRRAADSLRNELKVENETYANHLKLLESLGKQEK